MQTYRIAVIPGDGVGTEVIPEGLRVLRRAGEVVSKTELLDHVWDDSLATAPNAVEVYVGYLRRKIGRDRLQTVRGAGYRLAL